jgi:G3E family GTPase
VDQESEELAEGAYNFADILRLQKGDLIKAERLARESLRIREALHINMMPSDPHHYNSGRSKDLLARIKDQGN